MSKKLLLYAITAVIVLCPLSYGCIAEENAAPEEKKEEQTEEQGLDEIRQLVEISEVQETEGMGLEELTETFSDTAMADYSDTYTGFLVQYPSFFIFDEQQEIPEARTEDGKASLRIENMPNDGNLTEEVLLKAVESLGDDAVISRNEQNGCLRVDSQVDESAYITTDLYLIAEKSFHHITIRYPADEKDLYDPYITYMINTMEITGSEQG